MRWEGLLHDDPDVATPDFRGIEFLEIQARSIINRVPAASRVPFRWTINPYRGCSHACVYCLAGETPVLMADGRTRRLQDVRVGDRVYGTVRVGSHRRYVVTDVLAHWRTTKPAYRVTLTDGTVLVASGDHRFLTERGWRHVADAHPGQRPHLTAGNSLLGIGHLSEAAKHDDDYRRGYLTGIIRGDGHLGSHDYPRVGRASGRVHRFRLALSDREPLERARGFLADSGVETAWSGFGPGPAGRRSMWAIRCSSERAVTAVRKTVEWVDDPSDHWRLGFLAGVFDAEGSYRRGILRIASTDRAIIDATTSALRALGFGYSVDASTRRALAHVAILGGVREHVRFFLTTDTATTWKRTIDGQAVKCDADLRVVSVEPLGLELPMFDITTGTGDFIANGVVSHNCFARNTHTYLDLDAGRDFDSKIVVKVNAPQLLRTELAASSWNGEHIAMGTNVDCYQRAEGRYALMPGIIAALRDARNPFSILTKGSLILRDLPLLQEAAEVTDVGTNVSVGSVDRDLWHAVEPGTPSPQKRLEVCRALNDAGIPCGVLMAPVLPYLSDSPAQLDATVRAIAGAGATHVSPIVLHLRPGAREWFTAWLEQAHPDLVPRYRALYRGGSYAPRQYQERVYATVAELAERYGIRRNAPTRTRDIAPPKQVQLSLL